MRALTYHKSNDQFVLAQLDKPAPSADEVLVKVVAAGLNPVDAKIHKWCGGARDMDDTWVPGLDVSGIIEAVGANVEGWSMGDAVLYHGNMFKPCGGFAQYALADADALIPHPDVDPVIAAATPCAGWTAWRALTHKLQIENRKSLLVLGGSGGTGGFAIQIARYFGVETILATCSEQNADYVTSLGATRTIDYNWEDVLSTVYENTARQGVEVAFDTVGGDNDILAANCLGFEGHMVELVGVVRPPIYNGAFLKGLSFHQLSLGSAYRGGTKAKADLVKAGAAFSKLLEAGEITVPRLQQVSLEEAGDALKTIRNQRTVGKIVLKM
ncbi:zinc-binding dehydrogenase [Pseudovibrio sp. Tun.PSC04-5.I4]|uniref:alcohol dehydrogenase catalytic domain-containing protein n=1 Tax=Pseudovibrio sp. Tun.PSC04-5.I4 TaxID=1798213 RepID=UPI00088A0417|nr:zinc-binding dehydrogenase [Pseudovibrio sp. Tun.PSC04-5.I4]SDQ83861.1 NADPH:quinone reductase [Pseudovibrio sp. Tun.PSC04-5.I4]